jgi:hypothetical protein
MTHQSILLSAFDMISTKSIFISAKKVDEGLPSKIVHVCYHSLGGTAVGIYGCGIKRGGEIVRGEGSPPSV